LRDPRIWPAVERSGCQPVFDQMPGDINAGTANLTNQGLQRSLRMATYLKQQVLGESKSVRVHGHPAGAGVLLVLRGHVPQRRKAAGHQGTRDARAPQSEGQPTVRPRPLLRDAGGGATRGVLARGRQAESGRGRMQDKRASHTAIATAYLRAAHQILDSKPLILNDPIALTLLGNDAAKRIRDAADKYMSSGAKALRSHVVLRSRYTEDRLQSSLERGIKQYVIVGAGFDTFSIRQPDWAADLQMIEIDHPSTQNLKLKKIYDARIQVPSNVIFGTIDFEIESLEEGLIRNGIRNDRPTFFSWLGVAVYLTETAIDSTLKCMTKYPKGSEAIITFRQPQEEKSLLADIVTKLGEPHVSFFTPENFKGKLLEAGFTNVEFLTPELAACYFHEGENSLSNPEKISIVSAII
jgi:methyltransferase (TIGR00027 family)